MPLLLVCTLSVAALGVQLASGPSDDGGSDASGGSMARPPRPPSSALALDYPQILRAPIFSPDRTDAGGGPGADPGQSGAAPRILGVARGPRYASVILASGQARAVLRPGQSAYGWRLVAVDSGGATLERDGRRRRIAVSAPGDEAEPAAETGDADQ